ncbi:GntR family transcriptional regulator [Candidatus Poribacteria bacterium]|nr:GntR family transcriptional regulator [Candidatus Poribacteria bacterium]
MFFQVDFHDAKPVYQQLIDQVKFAVASGRLRPGEKLPSIRDVAIEVRVNRNTIARVYNELEREGIVYSRPGQGCFVSDRGSALSESVQREQLEARADELLAQARLFGFTRGQTLELIQERMAAVFTAPAKTRKEGAR